jgi:hypothetical protein
MVEVGEGLSVWIARSRPDRVQTIFVGTVEDAAEIRSWPNVDAVTAAPDGVHVDTVRRVEVTVSGDGRQIAEHQLAGERVQEGFPSEQELCVEGLRIYLDALDILEAWQKEHPTRDEHALWGDSLARQRYLRAIAELQAHRAACEDCRRLSKR